MTHASDRLESCSYDSCCAGVASLSQSAGGAAATAARVRILANNNKNNRNSSSESTDRALARAHLLSFCSLALSQNTLTHTHVRTAHIFVGFSVRFCKEYALNNSEIPVSASRCACVSVCVCLPLYALLHSHSHRGRSIASHRRIVCRSSVIHSLPERHS